MSCDFFLSREHTQRTHSGELDPPSLHSWSKEGLTCQTSSLMSLVYTVYCVVDNELTQAAPDGSAI